MSTESLNSDFVLIFVCFISIKNILLFIIFSITGGIILTSIAVILASLSFWITRSDLIADIGNDLMINFSSYPESIFKGISLVLLYTIIPVGIVNYLPIKVFSHFNIYYLLINILVTIILTLLAFLIFNKGLKRYSSSNLMILKI